MIAVFRTSAARHGFTIVEMLAAVGLLSLLGVFLGAVLNGSLSAVHRTDRMLQGGAAIREFCSSLDAELGALCSTANGSGVTVIETSEGVTLAIARPATRVRSLEAAGYQSQVVFRWNRKESRVTRSEYHSVSDREAASKAASDADGADHSSNLHRAAQLSPAWESDREGLWIDDPRLGRHRDAEEAQPLLAPVRVFEVTCFRDEIPPLQREGKVNSWTSRDTLPATIRVRVEFASGEGGEVRPYEMLFALPGIGEELAR